MSKEELVEKLAKVGIDGEWINPDEYGFRRIFQFELNGQTLEICMSSMRLCLRRN